MIHNPRGKHEHSQKYKHVMITTLFSRVTYLTDKEKSPGLDSLILIKNPPSGLLARSFSASALVILP